METNTKRKEIANLRRRVRRLMKMDGRWSWRRTERRILAIDRVIRDAKRVIGGRR